MKSVIERIADSAGGTIERYDGALCVWVNSRPKDLRDALPRGMSLADAQQALEEWDEEQSKARKAAVKAAKEKTE
jgi:hypothetical protein